jgi:hypothetical protein
MMQVQSFLVEILFNIFAIEAFRIFTIMLQLVSKGLVADATMQALVLLQTSPTNFHPSNIEL